MRHHLRRSARALPVLLTAACQPLPHPFAEDVPPPFSPSLSPRDSPGVVVSPVIDVAPDLALPLAEAMAAALRDKEIPASTAGDGNKRSYRLVAAGRGKPLGDGRSEIALAWELRAVDGRPLGHGTTETEAPSRGWQAGEASVLAALAAKAAPAIAQLMQDEPPRAAAVTEPRLRLSEVTGAPGDGGRALTRAMDFALRQVHIAIAEKPEEESFVLLGKVEMSPPAEGQQQVKVRWALMRADGHEIGQIDQQNAVPAGSLDGTWGEVALAVASAAAPGVAQLLERARP